MPAGAWVDLRGHHIAQRRAGRQADRRAGEQTGRMTYGQPDRQAFSFIIIIISIGRYKAYRSLT